MILAFLSALALYALPFLVGWLVFGKTIRWHIIPLMGITAIAYGIWRMNSPYPNSLNWDLFEHQSIVTAIRDGHWGVFPSLLSDTFRFDGYTTLFHTAIALAQSIFNPKILGFWWMAEAFHLFSAVVAAYVLTAHISKNRTAGLLAGLFSAFFFESSIVFAPLMLIPQTVAAVLWTFGLSYLLGTERPNTWYMALLSLLLVAMHMIVGGAGVLLYVLAGILMRIPYHKVLWLIGGIVGSASLYIGLNAVVSMLPLSSINYGEAGAYMQNTTDTLSTMRLWYGLFPLALFPIGYFFAATQGKVRTIIATIIFATAFAVVLSKAPYAMKFMSLARYPMIAVIAVGMSTLFADMGKKTTLIATGILIIALGTIFTVNTNEWKAWLITNGTATHVSTDDQQIARYLSTHATTGTMLISDPATQYILEGISGVNSQGGAYMNDQSRTAFQMAFTATEAATMTNAFRSIVDTVSTTTPTTRYIAISGRTTEWMRSSEPQRHDITYNIWRPTGLSVIDHIELERIAAILGKPPVYVNASYALFAI